MHFGIAGQGLQKFKPIWAAAALFRHEQLCISSTVYLNT
jgi:hypothetical protein